MIRALGLIAWVFVCSGAYAVSPQERLTDPALEARARAVSAELRCLVCQNQSIDDSDAELAKDLRRLVRERVSAGDSDAAVKSYLVQRYGEFVLLRPTFSAHNALLWLLPFLALLAGGWAIFRFYGRMAAPEVVTVSQLSDNEQQDLNRLLEQDGSVESKPKLP